MNFEQNIIAKSAAQETEALEIVEHFEKINLKKKDILHKKNMVCSRYYFLENGLLRFSHNTEEKDETAWIVLENTFFTDIFSLYDGKPSFFEIIALENSMVYSISKDELENLTALFPVLHEYLRKTWEYNFRNMAEIKLLQQFGNAKMRYDFLTKNEKWMKRVPQKFLASFMGMTPYTLSRIRRLA